MSETVLILLLIVVSLCSFFIGVIFRGKIFIGKTQGVINYYLDDIDDDLKGIQCSVRPDRDWMDLMDEKQIIFRITKSEELKETLNKKIMKTMDIQEKEN